jgi:hypothetical protein
MYFNAKDEVVTIVPNFSLPTENCTTFCIGVRAAAAAELRICSPALGCSCFPSSPPAAPLHTNPRPLLARAVQGEFGPFQPNRECSVPLWLAHTLWKRKRAAIRPPPWMDVEHLDAVLGLERQDASAFQPLPFHYIEVAHFLFTSGTDGNLPQEVFGDDLARVRAWLPGWLWLLSECG